MGRILAFDYGAKRVGIAVTDPLKIIANSLETIPTKDLFDFIKSYCTREEIEAFVVGYPQSYGNRENEIIPIIDQFIVKLQSLYPNIPVHKINEHYTSAIAKRTLIDSGVNKKERRNKGHIDAISANLILQTYLEMQNP